MFRFASPYFFLLLIFVLAAVFFRAKKQFYPAMGLSGLSGIRNIKSSTALKLGWIIPVLKYTALCLLIAALARPQWGTKKTNVMTEGINIILAVDLSESMAALDFKLKGKVVNRLEAVKSVVRDFIQKRTGDRIGMVVFGSNAYTQLPLTRDYNTIASILERLEIGAAGQRTAIGDAVGISLKRIEDIKSKSNIIILLTDGRSNSGELPPGAAVEIAVQKNVKIYTIGVGTRGKAPFLVRDQFFGERYVYQEVDIDEDTLKNIAEKTQGLYFRAEDIQGLEKIYETIDKLEKTQVKVQSFAEYNELYIYLLFPAFFLLCAWIILTNTRFLRIP
ncbi:von Willebrand factor A-like domain-containing protein [Desulfonema limicola]|uniref:von Willebrand factor A-like domain-containing protein n=1 Tax=Desulfonema limicola TaxID=45656 RepID=A0A975B9J2_9BACT|nr:VWA domain-containing protein [Desulfonema limicola]QTA81280.1 von Willebrand factor A-like domain-containing protein [Desulfonema limicola]